MTFKDLKKEKYHDELPLEFVLSDLLYKGKLDINTVLSSYTNALEKERHLLTSKFYEATINITQMLSDNFKNQDRDEMLKRAVHTYNMNKSMMPHVYDEKYGYTEEDEKKWDEFCKTIYGIELK